MARTHQLGRIIELAAIEGVSSITDVSMVASKRTKRAKLLRSIVEQKSVAVSTSSHIGHDTGVRIPCVICERSAPLSHTRLWFQKSYDADRGGRVAMVTSASRQLMEIVRSLEEDARQLRASSRLLR